MGKQWKLKCILDRPRPGSDILYAQLMKTFREMRSCKCSLELFFHGGWEQVKTLGCSLGLETPPGLRNRETWVVEVTVQGTIKMEEERPTQALFQKVSKAFLLAFGSTSGHILGKRKVLAIPLCGIGVVSETVK